MGGRHVDTDVDLDRRHGDVWRRRRPSWIRTRSSASPRTSTSRRASNIASARAPSPTSTLNRVDSVPLSRFAICEVVWQHRQFSWTQDGKSDRIPLYDGRSGRERPWAFDAWIESVEVAVEAMTGPIGGPDRRRRFLLCARAGDALLVTQSFTVRGDHRQPHLHAQSGRLLTGDYSTAPMLWPSAGPH